jgi:hypothetical protein
MATNDNEKDDSYADVANPSLHRLLTEEARKLGAKPRASQPSRDQDPLERFRSVPLHAVILYTTEDKVIDEYVKEHWAALDKLSADFCDIHPFLSQMRDQEDAYDFIDRLEVVNISGFNKLSELPGLFFWDQVGGSYYVPLVSMNHDQVVHAVKVIFEEIRRDASLGAVERAFNRLGRNQIMIDLLAAAQIATIVGNAVTSVDKVYSQVTSILEKRKGAVPPPSAKIENAPNQEAVVASSNGHVIQKITYKELAAKLSTEDLGYIASREQSLRNYQRQWEAIHPQLALASIEERARLELKLENMAKDMSADLSAIVDFLEKQIGVQLDDHYLAVREIAKKYAR